MPRIECGFTAVLLRRASGEEGALKCDEADLMPKLELIAPGRRHIIVLASAFFFLACSDPPPLDRAKVAGMIEATIAFQAPLDEDLRKLDPRFGADPYMKRELLRVEAISVKPDGPFGGMAGQTATVSFVWRFNQGPLAGISHRTIAKIHGDSKGWRVYEDKLAHNLRESIAGTE
ncbi:MAG TPA: hypothetical protein VMH79_08640 [Thermoanaerobaculia bacterium]|nr:hypothetical protein [Thermoanaerobaculia bacterium]